MRILRVNRDRAKLRQMQKEARELVSGARIIVCRNPYKAEAVAKAKGCDVLLTEAVFDGFSLDGVGLAETIQRMNPRVNSIFITDHADKYAALDAWKIGASAFLQRPYEKQRLARAFADPRFATA